MQISLRNVSCRRGHYYFRFRVWCFDVNTREEGKRVKNLTRLWSDLKERRDGMGQDISRWFARWRRLWLSKQELRERKASHSFRHTFAMTLKQAGLLDVRLAKLMGHSMENDQTFGRCGKTSTPAQRLDAIRKLDCGLDLAPLPRPRRGKHA